MDNCIFCGEPAADWPEHDGLDRYIRSIHLCDWHMGHALSACATPVYHDWKLRLSSIAEKMEREYNSHVKQLEVDFEDGKISSTTYDLMADNLHEIFVAICHSLIGSSPYKKTHHYDGALMPDGHVYDPDQFDNWLRNKIKTLAKKSETTGAHRCAAIRENGKRCVISVSKQGEFCSKCEKSSSDESKWAKVRTLIPELIDAWEKS